MAVAPLRLLLSMLCTVAVVPSCHSSGLELQGAGSSAGYLLLESLTFQYKYEHPDVSVSYTSMGSGRGMCRITDPSSCASGDLDEPQDIDFALSEYVLSDSDQIRYPDTKVKPALSLEATEYPKLHPEALDEAGNMKQRVLRKAYERHSNRWDYARQVFPASGTAIVPVYHLPELEERKASLRLSVGLLSRIYRCNVTRWNDPDILALNQGIQDILPDAPIEVVARLDGSGTTSVFKHSLAREDPVFRDTVGTASTGGEAGWPCASRHPHFNFRDRTDGVMSFVVSRPHSLGYVAYGSALDTQAHIAQLQTESSGLVVASPDSMTRGLESLPLLQAGSAGDSSAATAIAGWPLVDYTYFVIRTNANADRLRRGASCENVKQTVRFVIWSISSDSGKETARGEAFVPVPQTTQDGIINQLIADVKCSGEPAFGLDDIYELGLKYEAELPGWAPETLWNGELLFLATAYKNLDLSAQVIRINDIHENCTGALDDKEWFRVLTCRLEDSGQDAGAATKAGVVKGFTSIPFAAHGFAVVANIPGVSELVLDMPTVRAIMNGEVTQYNDEAISRSNPALDALNMSLTLVHTPMNAGMEIYEDGLVSTPSAGGCKLPTGVCLTTYEAAVHYVSEVPFSLALVPLFAIFNHFDRVIARISSEGGPAVGPSPQAIKACGMGEAGDAESGCYPLIMRSTLILRTDYAGPHPELATKVVEFWAWVIQDPGVALQLEFKPSRWQYYHSGPEQRRQQQALLESLMVNGKSVLAPSTSSQHNFAIKAGLGSAVVLCIVVAVVVGLVLVRRNRQLLRTVQRMKFDLGEELDHDLQWNLEVESPINKAINFLRAIADGKSLTHAVRDEAMKIYRMLKYNSSAEMPSALAALEGGDVPLSVKYVMGLQPRSGSGSSSKSLRINASSTDSLMSSGKFSLGSSKEDLGCPSVDPDDPNTVNPFTADRCSTTLSASEAGSPAPPSAPNLNGVGESFFCNVMHLRAHSISSPLAYVTYNVLLKSGLVTDLKLHPLRLQRYLAYIESAYVATNCYHNNWHAADVTLRCAAIIHALPMEQNRNHSMHCLAAILAACMHDAMHPGVDNNFVIKQQQALARRFNDQHVLEMNSLSTCLYAIHDQPQFNFLQGSTIGGTTTWLKLKAAIIEIVLATDMARHFDILSKFTTKLTGLDTSNPREQGKAIDDNIVLLMSMAIKAADLGHCASRWATHLYWSKCLEGEFFAQGDREHEAGVTLSPMMNRNGTSCMAPSSQVGFFDFIVMPLYTTLAKAFPGTSELANQAHANYRSWRRMQQNGEEPSLQDIGGYELQMSRHRHLDTLQDEAQETHSFAAAS